MKTRLERIQKDIETLATFTSTPGEGVTRASYTKEDRMAKDYLISEMNKLGINVYEDGFSTLFGRKDGKVKNAPVIMLGSHYDTVRHGGAFDGVAGTVAALEVMRVLVEEAVANDYPVELILMNAEEGETFGPSTGVSNSRAIMGTMTEKELDTVKNCLGQTKREAMRIYGVEPNLESCKRDPHSIRNFLELHIEQGPILDKEKIDIGLVEYLPGIGRYKVRFYGETADSTASMDTRRDALVGASQFVLEFNQKMIELGSAVTGMVGQLDIKPNSNQFVPDFVEGKIEIRTFDKTIVKDVNFDLLITDILYTIQRDMGIKTEMEEIARINYPTPTAPSVMNKDNIRIMEKICHHLGYSYRKINKGTGHDSMIMTDFVKTNMIYVPSQDGVSHCPQEWTDYEAIKKGADVLLNLVLELCINQTNK